MIIISLICIAILFVIFAFLRKPISDMFNFKICSICAAVLLTWLMLFVLGFMGYKVNNILIGILIGESIMGLMYMFENAAKRYEKKGLLWLKVFIILLGTYLAYLLLNDDIGYLFISLLVFSLLLSVLVIDRLKDKKTTIDVKKDSKMTQNIRKLEEKLEHCCD